MKDSELIASGRAFQYETGVVKQFILLWHVPGPGEPKPCACVSAPASASAPACASASAYARASEESRTSSVRSTQCKVRYRACVHDIVCVLHCYLRKRPGPYRCSHFSKLPRYCAALACCVLCAYCTSVSVQTANRIGVCSVGLLLVARSGVWSSLIAPLAGGGRTRKTSGTLHVSRQSFGFCGWRVYLA